MRVAGMLPGAYPGGECAGAGLRECGECGDCASGGGRPWRVAGGMARLGAWVISRIDDGLGGLRQLTGVPEAMMSARRASSWARLARMRACRAAISPASAAARLASARSSAVRVARWWARGGVG